MYFSCKDCVPPERHVGCHITCEKYIKECDENERIKEERKKNNPSISLHSNGVMFKGNGTSKRRKSI